MTGTPLSERKLVRYMNKKSLLSLPDDVLSQIASYLVPHPLSDPCTVVPPTHALALSDTCTRLREIVIPRLSTLNFLTPGSYTSRSAGVSLVASRRIERFIEAASPYVRDLRLPSGYAPSDGFYSSVAMCRQLVHLSLPVTGKLEVSQAQDFFAGFTALESVKLDFPMSAFVLGLCYAPDSLTEITFTRFPAAPHRFTALSALLRCKGMSITKLSVNLLCEDTKDVYDTDLNDSLIMGEQLYNSRRALARLSSLLRRHTENNGLQNLRELEISSLQDDVTNVETFNDYSAVRLSGQINHFQRAIRTACTQNLRPTGLTKFKIGMHSISNNAGIAFMADWVDSNVEVEVSFPDGKVLYPRNSSNDPTTKPLVKEMTLCFHCHSSRFAPAEIKFETETLRLGNDYTIIANNILSSALRAISPIILERRLQKLQITYGFPQWSVVKNMSKLLGHVADLVPELTTLELPADVVPYYSSFEGTRSLVEKSRYSIKILRLSAFRIGEMVLFGKAPTFLHNTTNPITVKTVDQKASWFLKGLPTFLRVLKRDFPHLEILYMEKTSVQPGVARDKDLFRALEAVGWYERTCGVDASTLSSEIIEWRRRSPTTQR